MRVVVLGIAAAVIAASAPLPAGACFTEKIETLRLELDQVKVDGQAGDASAYDAFTVQIASYQGDSFDWFADSDTEHFHAVYHAR